MCARLLVLAALAIGGSNALNCFTNGGNEDWTPSSDCSDEDRRSGTPGCMEAPLPEHADAIEEICTRANEVWEKHIAERVRNFTVGTKIPTPVKKTKKLKGSGGGYKGGLYDDLKVAFAPAGFKGRNNAHRSPAFAACAQLWAAETMQNDWVGEYDYDSYEDVSDDEERWDGEQGPYTYADFYEYYDHAEDARDAWATAEVARYSQFNGRRLLGPGEDDLDLRAAAAVVVPASASVAAAAVSLTLASAQPICDVCCEPSNGSTAGLKKRFTRSCGAYPRASPHSDGFCDDCVQSWIGAALDEERIVIRCPATDCDCRMSRENIKKSATSEQFALFEALSTRDYTAKYDEIMADPALAEWATTNTMQCPFCLQLVNRSDGCNHMACACGESFCYGCGGKTSGGEYSCRCYSGGHGDYHRRPETAEEQQLRIEVTVEYARELKVHQAQGLADSIKGGQLGGQLLECVEWRVDSTDGFSYPRTAFIEQYGSYEGVHRWIIAGIVATLIAKSNVGAASNIYAMAFQYGFDGHSQPWYGL
eukprot:gene5920-18357_t